MLSPAGEETLWCVFKAGYCGIVEICLDSIKVYDFLGIFYRKVKWNRNAQVKVMPGFELMLWRLPGKRENSRRMPRNFPNSGGEMIRLRYIRSESTGKKIL